MQAARGLIGLAGEFAARMEGGEDHLQRRELGEFRVRVGRDAAAVVAHGQPIAGLQRHLDAVGMAGHRLVHRVVDDLGGQVVQRVVVGAADIHARAAADGLQPLQHLDVLGGIGCRSVEGRCAMLAGAIFGADAFAPGRRPPNRSFMPCSPDPAKIAARARFIQPGGELASPPVRPETSAGIRQRCPAAGGLPASTASCRWRGTVRSAGRRCRRRRPRRCGRCPRAGPWRPAVAVGQRCHMLHPGVEVGRVGRQPGAGGQGLGGAMAVPPSWTIRSARSSVVDCRAL